MEKLVMIVGLVLLGTLAQAQTSPFSIAGQIGLTDITKYGSEATPMVDLGLHYSLKSSACIRPYAGIGVQTIGYGSDYAGGGSIGRNNQSTVEQWRYRSRRFDAFVRVGAAAHFGKVTFRLHGALSQLISGKISGSFRQTDGAGLLRSVEQFAVNNGGIATYNGQEFTARYSRTLTPYLGFAAAYTVSPRVEIGLGVTTAVRSPDVLIDYRDCVGCDDAFVPVYGGEYVWTGHNYLGANVVYHLPN